MSKITTIAKIHWCKFIFRIILFILALISYFFLDLNYHIINLDNTLFIIILSIIWIIFMIEILLRFIPNKYTSVGALKHLNKYYIKNENAIIDKENKIGVLVSSLSWIILNAIVLILYFNKIINEGMLVVITALYGVLDVFCILIYCPIQSWFLKNRCCVTCRIYNWDYVMLFTLLIFIPNFYTISLIVVSVLLLIKWEISRIIHPERFNESNNNLSCELCKEKSCKLKNNVNKIVNKFIKQ